MDKKFYLYGLLTITIFLILSFSFLICIDKSHGEEKLIKIRLGWQVPWATQGQLVQILKHTDIAKKMGLEIEFFGRSYGPELNELALAGYLDALLTADQPAATLFSKNKNWIGISRLMYNRTLTYVPINSPIKKMADLKGKTIGVPIGAAAERVLVKGLIRFGLDPKKDVKIINIGIREQSALVWAGGKTAKRWGNIDALAGFDPTPAIFETAGLINVVDMDSVISLVLMNENFIKQNPKAAELLVRAFIEAYDFYRKNRALANKWFMKEAGLKDANQMACDLAAFVEPNVWVKSRSDISLSFSEDDYYLMQDGADFIAPLIGKTVEMKKFVTNEYVLKIKLKF